MKIKFILILLNFSLSFCNESILDLLKNYYAGIYNAETHDIYIEILKMPDWVEEKLEFYNARISSNQQIIRVGSQHAWLTLVSNGKIAYKIPLSLLISVKKDVWVATRRIKREEKINLNILKREKREITNNYSKYQFGELDFFGKMKITRKIEAGTILTKQMFDRIPDVKRGDQVNVSLKGKTFSITLPGKVRQNGLIGEEIYVMVESTGKRLKGIIDSPKHIIVNK